MSIETSPGDVAHDRQLATALHARGDVSPERASPQRLRWFAPALALIFAALFLLGYLPRQSQRALLTGAVEARRRELPSAAWTQPKPGKPEVALTLPGNIQGLEETLIYARTEGYLAKLHVDLGDRVSEAQVLAELDTPETREQLAEAQEGLAQADAALVRAQAKHEHAEANLRRYLALAAGLTSREELDQKHSQARLDAADMRVAEAARNAQRANLERLKARQAFSKVRAPFAGTITARMIERGGLVSAGKSSPMFKLTSLDTLRVLVQVPQARAAAVRRDRAAQVYVPEYPKQSFAGRVTRTADALEASSRTMAVEVQVPNPERRLLPGMYGSVTLALESDSGLFSVPATALIVGEQGVHLARVDAQDRVQLIPVVVERDRGLEVDIANGLNGDERIILNPSPGLRDGALVRAAPAAGVTPAGK